VRLEIAKLHRTLGATMIYVTHDQVEAMTLADRIVVMNNGRIEQVGTPRELYETPANTFVATFIGSPKMTLLPVEADAGRIGLAGAGSIALAGAPGAEAGPLLMGVRADALTLAPGAAQNGFAGSVVYTEYLGDNAFVYARLAEGTQVSVRMPPGTRFAPDEPVTLGVRPGAAHFFARADGRRLPG
jgi:multiple sugar transport system ATP-binding protein